MHDDSSDVSYSSWGGDGSHAAVNLPDGAHLGPAAVEVSKELNRQITQASTMQELIHVVVVNFNRLNGVNLCTAYHRIARHAQDSRNPIDRWPAHAQAQLGGLLSRLNQALVHYVDQVQAQNLGITLWSISKVARVQQSYAPELIEALQREVAHRLHNVTQQVYMTDKHYKFGPQALSNIIYSAATMNLKLDYDLLHLVGKAIGWQIEEFKPQGLANTLWSLGKLGAKLTFEVRQLVDTCCNEMYNQLAHQRYKGTYAPQNISNALHGLAKLGYIPTQELLAELAKCAGQQLRHFGPQEITNMVWGFAQLFRNGSALPPEVNSLVDRIADELSLYFQDRQWRTKVKPQTISNLTWAYAALKRCPQKLNQDLIREMMQILAQFKPQELSNVLWALATMAHYPGPGVIDAMVQATCTVVTDMKPQEVSNTVWALATLRHFPGTAVLDKYINHAATMLDRFKSQEIGNLLWALARLGYMPAGAFALAVMPYIQSWRQTDVQDCGNLLWAFMILDVLTAEAVQLLGDRLRAMPREQFTQESYIQIYQAKISMSQKVATIAQHIPPDLLRQAELEWRQQSFHNRISKTHREVSEVLNQLHERHEMERRIEDGLLSVDIALTDRMVAVEVDGASHFSVNEPFVPLGKSVLRWRTLASRGWKVVTVPYYCWAVLRTMDEKKEYLWRLLQTGTVWECLRVDPNDRDALGTFPANMSHITPDEVMAHLEPGAVVPHFPDSLLPQASSPVSTLLGVPPRPGSNHSTPNSQSMLGVLSPTSFPPPSLPPRPSLGAARAVSGFGSPLNGSHADASAASTALGPSRLGGVAKGSSFNSSQLPHVSLPESLYGSSSNGGGVGGIESRPSISGLSVSAKPFTMSPSMQPALATQWSAASSSGIPTPRSVSTFSPTAQLSLPPAAYAAGLAGYGGGAGGSTGYSPIPSPSILPRFNTVPNSAYPSGNGRTTPASLSTPAQSPTAGSGLPLHHVLSAPAQPPGSAQSMSALGKGDSDDEIDDPRAYFAQVTGATVGGLSATSGPLSVEQVAMRVLALPSDRPVSELAPLLADWDGPKFQALLRALAGQATAARAVQLFDWARSLSPEHPQATALCVPSVYAAMMELHGQWRQPGKALRLLGDAKMRGVEVGSEIYSALVQSLCRSGEKYAKVALDTFQLMLSQGMAVEGPAFHSVLTAQLERGDWPEVTRLLDEMVKHDAELDMEVFNLVLASAAQAGERSVALAGYERMCEHGVAPTPDTFATLISLVMSSERGVEDVADALLSLADQAPLEAPEAEDEEKQSSGATASGALLTLLRACRATGQWKLAQLVLEGAPGHGMQPSVAAANEVIAACAAQGTALVAQAVFDSLGSSGLTPDAESYANLLQAYHVAGQWVKEVCVYEDMLAAGHKPTSEQHSRVISALFLSGVPWGQAKAVQFLKEADSSGALVAPTVNASRGIVKVDLNALDVGTGILVLYNWLNQMREGIGNSNTPGILDDHRRLVIVNGSSSTTPQGAIAAALKGSVGASLVTHKSPFRLSSESGRASRLEASTQMVKRWLFNETFQGWARLFSGEAGLEGSGLTLSTLPSAHEWIMHENQLYQDCHGMFAIIRAFEGKLGLDSGALGALRDEYRVRRRELILAAYQMVISVLAVPTGAPQVWTAAAMLMDRLGLAGYQAQSDAVLAAACVMIAGSREGIPIDSTALAAALNFDSGYEHAAAALNAEVDRITAVLGDTTCLSSIHSWKVYADRLGVAADNPEQMKAVLGDSFYTLTHLAGDDFTLNYPPSIQAAAIVYVARKQAGILPFWPSVLRELTGYDEKSHPQFADAIGEFGKPMSYGTVVDAAVFS